MEVRLAKNLNLVELSSLEGTALYLIIDKNSGLFRNGNLTGAKLAVNLQTAQVRRFSGCELVEKIDCYVQIKD